MAGTVPSFTLNQVGNGDLGVANEVCCAEMQLKTSLTGRNVNGIK